MAHDGNGRIFIGATGVEIADLRAVFHTSRNDPGAIITTAPINKWAKCKPVRSSALDALTDQDRAFVNHGLAMTRYTSPAAIVSGYSDDYQYLRPRGKATYNEWFRLLDFNGYAHYAESPVLSWSCPSGDVAEGTDLIVRLYLNPSAPAGSIRLSDITPGEDKPFSEYYFGVVIRTGTSSTYRVITMEEQIGTGSSIQERALTLPASLFSVTNDYTIYPIFSYTAYPSVTQQSSYEAGFFSVPGTTPGTIHITTIASFVSVAITDFTAAVGAGRYAWTLAGAFHVNEGTTVTGEILYRIYEGQSTSGTLVASGQFYYGQIAVLPNQTTHTETGIVRATTPEYLTAVLSYMGNDCLPVTIEII